MEGAKTMSYIGSFSKEEIEKMKRRLCDPNFDEELGIKLTYISPIESLGKDDNLTQGIIFTYSKNENEKDKGKGRSR